MTVDVVAATAVIMVMTGMMTVRAMALILLMMVFIVTFFLMAMLVMLTMIMVVIMSSMMVVVVVVAIGMVIGGVCVEGGVVDVMALKAMKVTGDDDTQVQVVNGLAGQQQQGEADVRDEQDRQVRRRRLEARWVWLVGCLTSQQQASVSQGQICSDNSTCSHTELEVVDQTLYLTQSQYTDTGPTSPSTDPITPGVWQGSHWSANFEVTGMTRPRKIPA